MILISQEIICASNSSVPQYKKMGIFYLPHITPTGLQCQERGISQPLKGRAHAILQMNT